MDDPETVEIKVKTKKKTQLTRTTSQYRLDCTTKVLRKGWLVFPSSIYGC